MKSIILANGLTQRTADSIARAGVRVNKKAVITAIKNGTLYPHCVPRHYGIASHKEVCRWLGVDPADLSPDLA